MARAKRNRTRAPNRRPDRRLRRRLRRTAIPGEKLDQQVRRVDEDRWLAARFAPAPARQRLMVLYALNFELARIAEAVSEPALGDIRLAWWRDSIDEIFAGKPARPPEVLQALAACIDAFPGMQAAFSDLIAARAKDFDQTPFATWADLDAYLDATAGALMRLACAACAPRAQIATTDAARAWGYAGLARAAPYWRARGRRLAPANFDAPIEAALIERARTASDAARAGLKRADAALFPAIGYVALAPRYLRRVERAQLDAPPLLLRQLKLIAAAATGAI